MSDIDTIARALPDDANEAHEALARLSAHRPVDEIPDPFDLPMDQWLDLDAAANAIATAMARFDAYVSNQQGACDTGTMATMLAEAKRRYVEARDG